MTQRRILQYDCPYHVTMVVRDRAWIFADVSYALRLAEIMLGACALKAYEVMTWAIHPDHIHLLVWKSIAARYVMEIAHCTCDGHRTDRHERAHDGQRTYDNVRCEDGIRRMVMESTTQTKRGCLP